MKLSEEGRKYLSNLIEALENLYLENAAAFMLLEGSGISDWYQTIQEYVQSKQGKADARQQFLLARRLIEAAQEDSKEFEDTLKLLEAQYKNRRLD